MIELARVGGTLLKRSLVVTTILLFALGAWLELSDQEAYYWAWSTSPDLCYFEHPPLQAWLTSLLTFFLGDGAWVVRLPALLGRIATLAFAWNWARRRFGPVGARASLWVLSGSFFFVAGSVLSLPDSLVLPLAILTMDLAERRRAWRAGLALGLAGLAKWTAALLAPGIAAAFLLRRPRDFAGLLKCGLTALALQIPVLYWNSQHEWASFAFHLHRRHAHGAAKPIGQYLANAAAFGGAQILLGGISFGLAFWAARRFLIKRDRVHSQEESMGLGWWIWPFLLVFGTSAVRGELRFYWTNVAFVPLALWLGAHLARLEPARLAVFARRQAITQFVTLVLVGMVLLLPVGAYLRPLTDTYKKYDLRHSPRGDLKGWKEWVEEDLRPAGWVADDVAYFGSDFHIAVQVAWATGTRDMSRVRPLKSQFQFAFWPPPEPPRLRRAVFAEDNRDSAGFRPSDFCAKPIEWRTREIKLLGETVKVIKWGTCEQYVLPDAERARWRTP